MKINIPAGTEIIVDKPTEFGITPISIVTKKDLQVKVVARTKTEYLFKFNTCPYAAAVEIQKVEEI